jgi:eukaryotic-like serine/threonine-protein kinase
MTPADSSLPENVSLVGRVLSDRYRIESVLGEGGMGAVYLAEHVLMHKRVAVKVLHPEMTRMPEVVARFEREAMAAAHIDHPNVAAATDFGKLEDGAFFLVLEYVEGTSLRDLLVNGPLDLARALHVADQIVLALVRAHSLGIVHRDLKPENVMLVERDGDPNFVKVLDFGIAKVPVGDLAGGDEGATSGKVLTQLGMVYGTPDYMAPEQALGQEIDARADLYALGVIIYEMLTGRRPFEGDNKIALLGLKVTNVAPSLSAKRPDARFGAAVEQIVARLLEKEAAKRFQDAREVGEAIEKVRVAEAQTELPFRVPTALGKARDRVAAALGSLARLPQLRRIPPVVKATAAGALFAVVFAFAVIAMRGGTAKVTPGVAGGKAPERSFIEKMVGPKAASSAELAAAVAMGPEALQDLSERYQKDPAVLRALVKLHMSQKHGPEAMSTIGRLVDLDNKAIDDDDVQDAIFAAAQGQADMADAAFSLMEDKLGSKGAELLYDLSTTKGVNARTTSRAKQSLAKPELRAKVGPALQVALDLKSAKGCEAKRALLPRLKAEGDRRALAILKPLQDSRGCGFMGFADCWPCLHRDGQLTATIAEIAERTGK